MYSCKTSKTEDRSRPRRSLPAREKATTATTSGQLLHGTAQMKPYSGDLDELHGKLAQRIDSRRNRTGLPDSLKFGIENLSGYSMDDVRVHYSSPRPAAINAYAYTQGSDIHVAPGQEKHLPHEAWHVVQQKQGRVRPTYRNNGVNINDNPSLEHEADINGNLALKGAGHTGEYMYANAPGEVAQLVRVELNRPLAGEDHDNIIGLNFMPGGGLRELLPGNGRGYSVLSDKIAGHTSMVSWRPGQNNEMDEFLGKGFSPKGLLNSLKVGVVGFLPQSLRTFLNIDDINVPGDLHVESQAVVEDPRAHQLVIHVSDFTFEEWRRQMNRYANIVNDNNNPHSYSFMPETASNIFFKERVERGERGTDNCTTMAMRNAFEACDIIRRSIYREINNPQNNMSPQRAAVLQNDMDALLNLRLELANMMNDIVNRNLETRTTRGTQGRAIRAFMALRDYYAAHPQQ